MPANSRWDLIRVLKGKRNDVLLKVIEELLSLTICLPRVTVRIVKKLPLPLGACMPCYALHNLQTSVLYKAWNVSVYHA